MYGLFVSLYNYIYANPFCKRGRKLKGKVIGLIGKKKPVSLLIKTRFGIHTFGLKFPIDVLILDKKNKIVSLKKSLKPNRIFLWNPLYEKVLELPEGTINEEGLKVGHKLNLKLL